MCVSVCVCVCVCGIVTHPQRKKTDGTKPTKGLSVSPAIASPRVWSELPHEPFHFASTQIEKEIKH